MFKVGDSEFRMMRRESDKGEEVLTKQNDGHGHEITTYHLRTGDGSEVTIHGNDEAMVKAPDGSISYFQLIKASGEEKGEEKFELCEGVRFTPSGVAESFDPGQEREASDLSLVESAKMMFAKASASPDGFEEVDEGVFEVSES